MKEKACRKTWETVVNITWGASSSVLHLQAKAAQTCNAFKCSLIYLYFWHSLKKRKQNLLVKISLVLLQARCVCSYFGLSGCVGVTLSIYWFFTNLISWKHVSLISPNGYDCYLHLFYVILVTVMGSFFIMRLFLFNINRCIKSLFFFKHGTITEWWMSTSQLKGRIFLKNNLFIRFLLYTLKSCFDQLSRYFRQLHLNCFYPLLDVNILDQKQEEEKKMDQNLFFFLSST